MTSVVSFLFRTIRDQVTSLGQPTPMDLDAVPGLVTLLDLALYRSNEGGLTATVCASNILLRAFLELKRLSLKLLNAAGENRAADAFASLCLDCARDAIIILTTDRLAQSANVFEGSIGGGNGSSAFISGSGSNALVGVGNHELVTGVVESKEDTGRITLPSRRDCWESPRLFCPDFVWADDCLNVCQRLLRTMAKQNPFLNSNNALDGWTEECVVIAELVIGLVNEDFPIKMSQFKAAIEAETVVSKRLFLVKCEYRAPFRAFLEAHDTVQRAPQLEMVDEYLELYQHGQDKVKKKKAAAESIIQDALKKEHFQQALILEQQCEALEIEIARALYPFTELARLLDSKKASLKCEPAGVEASVIPRLYDLLKRLKFILCRKAGPETSSGIRPILLDLQGIPRDDLASGAQSAVSCTVSEEDLERRVKEFAKQLGDLVTMTKNRGTFIAENRKEVEVPPSIQRGTNALDSEMLVAQFWDYVAMTKKQHDLLHLENLSDTIRKSEIEVSIAVASKDNLKMVRQKLESMEIDRTKRFDVLKEIVEDVCQREMNLQLNLKSPKKNRVLELPEMSALGVFGVPLLMAGESLPIG